MNLHFNCRRSLDIGLNGRKDFANAAEWFRFFSTHLTAFSTGVGIFRQRLFTKTGDNVIAASREVFTWGVADILSLATMVWPKKGLA